MQSNSNSDRTASPNAQDQSTSTVGRQSPLRAVNPTVAEATVIRIEDVRRTRAESSVIRDRYLAVFVKHAEVILGTTNTERKEDHGRRAA